MSELYSMFLVRQQLPAIIYASNATKDLKLEEIIFDWYLILHIATTKATHHIHFQSKPNRLKQNGIRHSLQRDSFLRKSQTFHCKFNLEEIAKGLSQNNVFPHLRAFFLALPASLHCYRLQIEHICDYREHVHWFNGCSLPFSLQIHVSSTNESPLQSTFFRRSKPDFGLSEEFF